MLSLVFFPSLSCQMDSGYNTQNCGSNIMDTVGADSDAQTLEVENKSQVLNTKVWKKTKHDVVVGYKYLLNVICFRGAWLAQLVERVTLHHGVGSSSPT